MAQPEYLRWLRLSFASFDQKDKRDWWPTFSLGNETLTRQKSTWRQHDCGVDRIHSSLLSRR